MRNIGESDIVQEICRLRIEEKVKKTAEEDMQGKATEQILEQVQSLQECDPG